MRLKKCLRKKSKIPSLPGSNLGLLCKQLSHTRLRKCNPYTQLSGTYYTRNVLILISRLHALAWGGESVTLIRNALFGSRKHMLVSTILCQ